MKQIGGNDGPDKRRKSMPGEDEDHEGQRNACPSDRAARPWRKGDFHDLFRQRATGFGAQSGRLLFDPLMTPDLADDMLY